MQGADYMFLRRGGLVVELGRGGGGRIDAAVCSRTRAGMNTQTGPQLRLGLRQRRMLGWHDDGAVAGRIGSKSFADDGNCFLLAGCWW